jgi:probable F420-dependent oxidoreductase
MKLGLSIFLTDQVIDPVRLAREAEDRGFHSLYFPEHTHIPVARTTPHPSQGRDFDESYRRTLDPYIACAFAASATSRILLGTGVSVIAQHDPIILAKEIATLDLLSGGRFVLGIGYGWNRDEITNHGIDPTARRSVVREHLLAMTELWSKEEATFAGRHISFPPSWSYPKPLRRPRPRTLIGGSATPTLLAHIAEFADGWMPLGGAGVGDTLPLLHKAFSDIGRDPSTAEVIPFGTQPTPGKLDYYESLGIEEVVAALPYAGADQVLPVLDEWARTYARFLA